MNPKVIVGILLVVAGLALVVLGAESALRPAETCILFLCATSPFAWVPGLLVALVGGFVAWLGVKVV